VINNFLNIEKDIKLLKKKKSIAAIKYFFSCFWFFLINNSLFIIILENNNNITIIDINNIIIKVPNILIHKMKFSGSINNCMLTKKRKLKSSIFKIDVYRPIFTIKKMQEFLFSFFEILLDGIYIFFLIVN
jgi:hypothetical protein